MRKRTRRRFAAGRISAARSRFVGTELSGRTAVGAGFGAPMPRIAASLRSLSVAADQGVWTKTALLQSFASYADKAVLSETVSPKKDWFHQALNSLKTLVVIRRIDASDADNLSTQAVLARAQQAVDNADLAVAVMQLQSLQGTAKEIMKDWTQAAQRYLTTQKTISETVSAVLGVIYANQAKGE